MNPNLEFPFVRATYGGEWIRRYVLKNYIDLDPVLERGLGASEPFYWADVPRETRPVQEFFADAMAHGVGNCGYTVPIADKNGRRAMFTVNDEWDAADFAAKLAPAERSLRDVALVLHRKALIEAGVDDDPPALSPREIECLIWTARGKDANTVAEILDISEHTVRDYLKSAKSKLGCSTIAQAVFEATRLNLIRP